ncbi:MAG: 50S ribosomal protein L11 methyltransferase [Polyangiaceae bacterium]|nr:50S ribosomal protein L11 methyltransferase [Polyangiaceae bacterium]
MFELGFAVRPRDVETVSARLFAAGAGAVEEREGPTLVVWVQTEADAAALSRAAGLEPARRELDASWQTEWLRHLGPVVLTERIVLQPTTDLAKLPRGKRRIWFEPDQAFGDGSHATTRLAARATERLCRERAPARVLDVGTGNGVLALVAAVSRASRVLGVDVDPSALRAARKNARRNKLSDRCSFSGRSLAEVRGRFDLVLANIEAWVLLELAHDLARVTAPTGHLVLSGLLRERGAEVLARFSAEGLSAVARDQEDGWLGLVLRPSARA